MNYTYEYYKHSRHTHTKKHTYWANTYTYSDKNQIFELKRKTKTNIDMITIKTNNKTPQTNQ